MLKKIITNFAYLLLMLTLGFAIYYYFLNPNSRLLQKTQTYLSTDVFFNAQLPDAVGNVHAMRQYQHKIIVVNFWATWCQPCREEMPELSNIHDAFKDKNVVVLGLAIDESALVREFQQTTPVRYPLFIAEDDGMMLANVLGNTKGVLPYTLIIDANGLIVKTYFGKINFDMITTELNRHINTQ